MVDTSDDDPTPTITADHEPCVAHVGRASRFTNSRDRHRQTAHPTIRAGVEWILRQFDQHPTAISAQVCPDNRKIPDTLIYRVCPRIVLVAGKQPLSDVIRALFPLGEWRLRPVPLPGTPLESLQPVLGTRVFNFLAREGFVSVEEVAAVPEAALREIDGFGKGAINTLRGAIGAKTRYHDDDTVTLSARQLRELSALLAALSTYATAQGQGELARRVTEFSGNALRPHR